MSINLTTLPQELQTKVTCYLDLEGIENYASTSKSAPEAVAAHSSRAIALSHFLLNEEVRVVPRPRMHMVVLVD